MNASNSKRYAYVFRGFDDASAQEAVGRFRKELFVDRLGWELALNGACEVDEFDTDETVYASVSDGNRIVGAFRAIRSDWPYLAQTAFPSLATTRSYPRRADIWEISRFGVLPGAGSLLIASTVYALMFQFALMRRAKALVAVTDLFHERQLSRRGIRTRRYGKPQIVGVDRSQRPITVVAGEIPIEGQDAATLRELLSHLNGVMIYDQTLVFGRSRISA